MALIADVQILTEKCRAGRARPLGFLPDETSETTTVTRSPQPGPADYCPPLLLGAFSATSNLTPAAVIAS